MGGKFSKEKGEDSKGSRKSNQGPLPHVPSANAEIVNDRRKEKTSQESLTLHVDKNEFSPNAKIYLVLHDFDARGHKTISVKKNEKVELLHQTSDWSDVYVPRLKARGWIPYNYLAPLNSLSRYPWYHKKITRNKAEYLLRNGINGSFLVRQGETNPGQYSLSVRHDGKKYHYRIQEERGKLWITEECKFKDLSELIHHHSLVAGGLITTLTHPVPNVFKPPISSLTMSDEWEIDRDTITLGEKLGSGQYGEVYKGEWIRSEDNIRIPIAVKTLKADSASQEEFLKEASIMKRLRHDNLLHLLGICTIQKPFFIITEYMPLGNLLDYIRSNKDHLAGDSLMHVANQIASGMSHLEVENLVHRDLACRNCLVGENLSIRICDFGLSRLLDEDAYTAREGTKFPIKWTAPEALNYNTFTMKSDVWSYGIVLWELATQGETPYPGIDLQNVLPLLETGHRMQRPEGCPEKVYKMMRDCWQWEPDNRPTFADINARLDNMFVSSSVEEEVAKKLEEDTTPAPTPRPLSPNKPQRHEKAMSATTVDQHNRVALQQLEQNKRHSSRLHSPMLTKPQPMHPQHRTTQPMGSYNRARPPHPNPPPRGQYPAHYTIDQYPELMGPDLTCPANPPRPTRPHQYYPNKQYPGHHPNYPAHHHRQPHPANPQPTQPRQSLKYPPQHQAAAPVRAQFQPRPGVQQPAHPALNSRVTTSSPARPQPATPRAQIFPAKPHHSAPSAQPPTPASPPDPLMDISNNIFNNSGYNSPKSESALSLLSQESRSPSLSLGSNRGTSSPVVTPAPVTTPSNNKVSNINNLNNSNNSSSPVLNNNRAPNNNSPSSGGTNFMSELKTRQTSVRKQPSIDNIETTPVKPVILKPVALKPVALKPVVPSVIQTQKPVTPVVLPTKPKIIGLKKTDQFCVVNPTSIKPSCEDKPVGNGEDFSFQTLIARAKNKEGETKGKPVPPPKPKINLNS